ncbi:MAG TPA: WbqC family protein [Cyclobacteriaceae bacterium]|nr:WbqC family protein [Cyclobacteriaceae bacterium]HRJ82018.1 WbqC family protein [Cyclobacteriaceae bacterium]
MNILIEPHYLPTIAWFSTVLKHDAIILEKHEHFVKQSFRNRCAILTTNGIQTLTVPVTGKHGKVALKDVKIDYTQKWLNNHWRTITSAYRNAPFFEHYADDLHDNLFKQQTFLYDLNYNLLTMCLGWLRIQLPIQETSVYEKTPKVQIADLRNCLSAKKDETLDKYYQPIPYTQVFGKAFVKHLSIIDLIFCQGPEARQFVEAQVPRNEQIK